MNWMALATCYMSLQKHEWRNLAYREHMHEEHKS